VSKHSGLSKNSLTDEAQQAQEMAALKAQQTLGHQLIAASENGCIDKAQEIIKKLALVGANLDLQNADGWSALMCACQNGHTDVADKLISAGANLDLQNKDGLSALMGASNKDVADVLISAGAKLDLQDKNERSALMLASAFGRQEVVHALISAGANLDLQSMDGLSALMKASTLNHQEVADMLISAGARLDLQTKIDCAVLSSFGNHMFCIKETNSTGLGLFATCNIPANTPLIDESLTFQIPMSALSEANTLSSALSMLTQEKRCQIDSLHGNSVEDKLFLNGVPLVETQDVYGIQTRKKLGIYVHAARLNHACRPNAVRTLENNVCSVVSQKMIKKGEQITISYLKDNFLSLERRGEYLRFPYWNRCRCELCNSSEIEKNASDKRRTELATLRDKVLLNTGDGARFLLPKILSLMASDGLPMSAMGNELLMKIISLSGPSLGDSAGQVRGDPEATRRACHEKAFSPGRQIVLHKLGARPELNGRKGVVNKKLDRNSGRVGVLLDVAGNSTENLQLSVKPHNLFPQ